MIAIRKDVAAALASETDVSDWNMPPAIESWVSVMVTPGGSEPIKSMFGLSGHDTDKASLPKVTGGKAPPECGLVGALQTANCAAACCITWFTRSWMADWVEPLGIGRLIVDWHPWYVTEVAPGGTLTMMVPGGTV
jgi:hypothetical protein